RKSAVDALGTIGQRLEAAFRPGNLEAKKAIQPLIGLLKDRDADVRRKAAEALYSIGPDPSAVPKLIDALGDSDGDVRRTAAEVLGLLGPEGGTVVPSLITSLNDPVLGVRWAAAEALGTIGPSAKEAVQGITRLVREDASPDVRR